MRKPFALLAAAALALGLGAGPLAAQPAAATNPPETSVTTAVERTVLRTQPGAQAIEVSQDGTTFGPGLQEPVFNDVELLVPGDTVNDSIWLRNASSLPVEVSLIVEWAGPPEGSELDDLLTITVEDASATVTQLRAERLTTAVHPLEPGGVVEVPLSAHLPLEAGNSTQRDQVQLRFLIGVGGDEEPTTEPPTTEPPTTQPPTEPPTSPIPPTDPPTTAPPGPPDGPGDSPTGPDDGAPGDQGDRADEGPLARTGAEVAGLIAVGLLILGAGIALVLAARRRRDKE